MNGDASFSRAATVTVADPVTDPLTGAVRDAVAPVAVSVGAPVAAAELGQSAARVEALDLARFIMALVVVGAHGRLFVDLSYPLYFFTFVGGWARIIIPLFLMMSGFFFAVQIRRGVGAWAKRLVLLHLVWSAVYIGCWMPLGSFSFAKAGFWIFFGAGHLWFMPALIGGGLMLARLRGLPAGWLLALAGALYLTGGVVQYALDVLVDFETVKHHNALYALPRNFLFYGFPFMALGYLMQEEAVRDWLGRVSRWPVVLGLVALLMLENWVKYVGFAHDAVFEVAVMNFALAPVIFAWLLRLKGVRAAPWMAPMSAAIYFVHALVLLVLEQVAGLTPSLLTLVAVVICLPVGWVLVKANNRPLPLV
ncbi:acyltransferase [Rhodobacteraceae bacterium D3-12]|nr:acyltransferase [Rhodobacteraceae bacterium D3-12]